MSDHVPPLSSIRRPALLVRAARFALRGYSRQRDLQRLVPGDVPHTPSAVLPRILAAEAEVETARRAGAGHYDPARHIALLVAIMGEARLVAAP
jgi:hypothetical protein